MIVMQPTAAVASFTGSPYSQRRAIFDMTNLDHDGCEVVVRGLMVVTEDGWSVTWACSQDARIRPDGE